MTWYIIAAIVVVGLVYWFFLRGKKPAAGTPMSPVQPQAPQQPQQPPQQPPQM